MTWFIRRACRYSGRQPSRRELLCAYVNIIPLFAAYPIGDCGERPARRGRPRKPVTRLPLKTMPPVPGTHAAKHRPRQALPAAAGGIQPGDVAAADVEPASRIAIGDIHAHGVRPRRRCGTRRFAGAAPPDAPSSAPEQSRAGVGTRTTMRMRPVTPDTLHRSGSPRWPARRAQRPRSPSRRDRDLPRVEDSAGAPRPSASAMA